MNKATLQLFWDNKITLYTFKGWWGHPSIYFGAPAWKNNLRDVSCIPQGIYNVTRHESKPRFRILNVPGRDNIEIHEGNYASVVDVGGTPHLDSEGCYLAGFDYDKKTPMIKKSVRCMDYLLENIKENFAIEVRFMLPPIQDS